MEKIFEEFSKKFSKTVTRLSTEVDTVSNLENRSKFFSIIEFIERMD